VFFRHQHVPERLRAQGPARLISAPCPAHRRRGKIAGSDGQHRARQFGTRILEAYGATDAARALLSILNKPALRGRRQVPAGHGIHVRGGGSRGRRRGACGVRGPNVMRGYLNAEANEKFLAGTDGTTLATSARVDEDGFLFILGRLKAVRQGQRRKWSA